MNYKYLPNHTMISNAKKIFVPLFLFVSLGMQCQEGCLDTTFNSTGSQPGVVLTSIGTNGAVSFAVTIQSDRKIIAAGTDLANFVLARYLIDGTLDTTFNSTGSQPGVVTTAIGSSTSSSVQALAVQPDGKILAAGTDGSNFVISRYLIDGTLDITFNSKGTQPGVVTTIIDSSNTNSIESLAVQIDGKILVAGTDGSRFVLARYLTDGSLDEAFNGSGTQPGVVTTVIGNSSNSAAHVVIPQENGGIIVIGTDGFHVVIARYLINGALDMTFNSSGKQPGIVITLIRAASFAYSGVVQDDNKIVAVGFALNSNDQCLALARYLSDGSLDDAFGTHGIVVTSIADVKYPSANAVTIQADGKIVVAGKVISSINNENFALARYLINGALDTNFGTNGIVINTVETDSIIFGLALQEDGKIIVAGCAAADKDSFAIARYISKPALHQTIINEPSKLQLGQQMNLTGTAQSESIVTLIIDGVLTKFSSPVISDASEDETNTIGTWSIMLDMLPPGQHKIIAVASYKTGNVILYSDSMVIG